MRLFRTLNLSQGIPCDVLETPLRQAQAEPMAPIDLIACLVSDELARRSDRLLERRRKQAGFRDPDKSLDKFDFSFNPKMNPLGEDLFRVEESSFITDATYRDVIRVREAQESALVFVEIAERSPLVTNSWILSQDVIESEAMKLILERIMAEGGNWEQVFGGGLIVHSSPDTAQQIGDQIVRIANSKQSPSS